jgi:hypothetical protein
MEACTMEQLLRYGIGMLALASSGVALAQQTPDVDGYLGRAVLRTLPEVDPCVPVICGDANIY